jgi:hypothetical protein
MNPGLLYGYSCKNSKNKNKKTKKKQNINCKPRSLLLRGSAQRYCATGVHVCEVVLVVLVSFMNIRFRRGSVVGANIEI